MFIELGVIDYVFRRDSDIITLSPEKKQDELLCRL